MDQFVHILEIISAMAMPVIGLVMVWVRKLMDEIHGLRSTMSRMDETMQREHNDVLEAIQELDGKLTLEVRGLINQHADHERVQAVIAERIRDIKNKVMG